MTADVYREIEGVYLGKHFTDGAILSVLAYKPSKGDVFIVSYPKCGTTWMQHIVYNIYMDANPPKDILDVILRMPFLEIQGAGAATHGLKPGALKTHLAFHKHPYSEDAKYIYITRNPYDCCVSFFHHTRKFPMYHFEDGTFDEFFEYFLEGNVDFGDFFEHLLSWYEHRNDPNVLFLTYEALKADTKSWILRIADFLGEEYGSKLRHDDALLEKILEMTSLESMKSSVFYSSEMPVYDTTTSTKLVELHPALLDGLKAFNKFMEKPMTGDFVRKGIVGDWRTHFSEDQLERMRRHIAEKTKDSDVMSLWKDLEFT